ncbi:unnamed protein product [Colias eurytheme]|nr:unnamed protein product [Colias eurytheme]
MPRYIGAVWDYFLMLSESDNKKYVSCNYCNVQYKFAQATRLKEHLLKCKKCPIEVKKKFRPEKSDNRANITEIPVLSPASSSRSSACTSTASSSSATTLLQNTSTSSDLQSSSRDVISYSHADVDTVVARAIYASGVPLSLLECEYWKDVFNVLDPSYTVPSRHALSNPLLQAEHVRIKEEIGNKLQKSVALGLICDGWTNIVGKGVINFMIATPKPIFYNAIYCETQKETGQFLSEQMIKIIEEVGPAKFVAVITDNAANMKAAWAIVTAKFPHIACVGCVSHALNLIYKDIFKITLFEEVLRDVVKVIRYIKRAHIVLALFEKFQIEKYGRTSSSLKLFSKTRWSGAYITIKSYKGNREALELLAKCHETDILLQIKTIILDSQIWIKIDEVVKVLEPIAKAILISEKNSALLSDVPYIFNLVSQELNSELETAEFLSQVDKNVITTIIQNRKKFCMKPIHYTAHQLDPRYCGVCLTDEQLSTVAEYLREVSTMLGIEAGRVLKDMAEFREKENFFDATKAIWTPVKELEPRIWWKTFASNSAIAKIAQKILSVPPSSAASKRNWSLFSRTHTKLRNRLHNSGTVKLISIRSNLNLFRRESTNNVTVPDLLDEDSDDVSDNECEITDRDPLL